MTDAVKAPAGGGLGKKAADVLGAELRNLMAAMGERAVRGAAGRIEGLSTRLVKSSAPVEAPVSALGGDSGESAGESAEVAEEPREAAAVAGVRDLAQGKSPVKAALSAGVAGVKAKIKQVLGKGGKKGGKKKKLKVTNIVETVDVGVPVRVAYDQWTQFADFPSFMKKVESVEQASDEKLNWKAQIFWSHRTWESTIVEQVPDEHIIWRSKGPKGSVDGTVSFHELAPDLTRILLIMEYHPQGLFERTGNIWRAQGRRARLELKHYVRHVMTRTILEQEQQQGWRGEIRDSRVVRSHEEAMEQEREPEEPEEEEEEFEEGEERDEGEAGEPERGRAESQEAPPRGRPEQRSERPGGRVRPARRAAVGGPRR
jgi:uncharacterized membrane protein